MGKTHKSKIIYRAKTSLERVCLAWCPRSDGRHHQTTCCAYPLFYFSLIEAVNAWPTCGTHNRSHFRVNSHMQLLCRTRVQPLQHNTVYNRHINLQHDMLVSGGDRRRSAIVVHMPNCPQDHYFPWFGKRDTWKTRYGVADNKRRE